MARVELPERSRDSAADAPAAPRQPAPRGRRRWWPRLLLLALAGLAVLPTALSIFGQVPVILGRLHPQLAEAVQFRTISLHWWAPVEINGCTVRDLTAVAAATADPAARADAAGAAGTDAAEPLPLLQAERITTEQPLWKIVTSLGRGTAVVLTELQLNLIVDEQGTNLERTLTEVFGETESSSDDSFPVRVTIHNGSARLMSSTGQTQAAVTDVQGTLSTLHGASLFPELQLTARLQSGAEAELTQRTAKQSPGGRVRSTTRLAADLNELTADFSVVPLDSLADMPAAPGSADAAAAGTDSGGTAPETSLQIRITAPAADQPRQSLRLAARQLDLRLLQPLLTWLDGGAGLMYDGIVSCDLESELGGQALSDGIVGRLLLQGQQLRVRQVSWAADEWLQLGPTVAAGAIAVARDGILMNQLRFESDVLTATGSGELRAVPADAQTAAGNKAELQGSLQLARVAAMLPKTLAIREDVVLTGGQLTFAVSGEYVAAATEGAEAAATAKAAPGVARWQATVANDRLQATRGGQPLQIDAGMQLAATGPFRDGLPELAALRLTAGFGTIDCRPQASGYLVTGRVQPVQLWQQLQQFMEIPHPGLHDELQFSTVLNYAADATQLSDLQLTSRDLQVRSPRLQIHHLSPLPRMLDGTLHAEGSGAAMRTLVAPWHSATWLAEDSRVTVDVAADPRQQVQLRAVVQPGPLAAAAHVPVRSVAQHRSRPGAAAVRHQPAAAAAAIDTALQVNEGLAELNLATTGNGDVFTIRSGQLQLPGIAAVVSGTVVPVGSDVQLDLTADTQYDLDILCQRLLAPDAVIRLSGRGQHTFRLTGSPSLLTAAPRTAAVGSALTPLQASGGIAWQSGSLWGLPVGPASVSAILENGLLRTQPVQCRVSTGEVHVMPQYDLLRQRLQLATGSRVENLELTPEICREWVAYLTPLLADATNVTGRLSARVVRFDYDMQAPQSSDVAAVVSIHAAEASPGASLRPLLEGIDLLRRAQKADRSSVVRSIILPTQEVPLELRQGYVVHQGLQVELAGYRTVSSGAVGLNRRLQLTLDVPLEKAAGDSSYRSVRIPIGGTIERPEPDTAALLQSLGTQAIEQRLNNQLDRQLNKLLDRF